MMQTDYETTDQIYTIHFELDNQNEINVEQVIRASDGRDVWGDEWFMDFHSDQVLAECKQFLNENI